MWCVYGRVNHAASNWIFYGRKKKCSVFLTVPFCFADFFIKREKNVGGSVCLLSDSVSLLPHISQMNTWRLQKAQNIRPNRSQHICMKCMAHTTQLKLGHLGPEVPSACIPFTTIYVFDAFLFCKFIMHQIQSKYCPKLSQHIIDSNFWYLVCSLFLAGFCLCWFIVIIAARISTKARKRLSRQNYTKKCLNMRKNT